MSHLDLSAWADSTTPATYDPTIHIPSWASICVLKTPSSGGKETERNKNDITRKLGVQWCQVCLGRVLQGQAHG